MNELCGCQPKSRQSANMGGRKHGEPGRPEKKREAPAEEKPFPSFSAFLKQCFSLLLARKIFLPSSLYAIATASSSFFPPGVFVLFLFWTSFFFVCLFCQLFFFQFLLGEWKRRTREVAPVYASFSRDKIRVVTMQKESKNHCELLRQLISTHV